MREKSVKLDFIKTENCSSKDILRGQEKAQIGKKQLLRKNMIKNLY